MELNTPITTAARRIVKELRGGTPNSLYYFDAEGRYVTGHIAGLFYSSREAREEATAGSVVALYTSPTVTQRSVQDHLDAAQAHGTDWDARTIYLDNLDAARELANH